LLLQNYSSSQWDLNRILSGNPVAAAVVNDASIQQGFFWSSHTFTHQNLDNATIQDSAAEVSVERQRCREQGCRMGVGRAGQRFSRAAGEQGAMRQMLPAC
jgi:hypothetical protein